MGPRQGDRSARTPSAGTEVTAPAGARVYLPITTGALPRAGITDILPQETIYTEGAAVLQQGRLHPEVTVHRELQDHPNTRDPLQGSGVHAAVGLTGVREVQAATGVPEAEALAATEVPETAVEAPAVSGVPAAAAEAREA